MRSINQRSMSSDLLQITIILSLCVRLCSKSTQPDITYYAKNGRRCVKCAPGTKFVADCETENESAKCQLCPDGYYSSQYNIASICTKCKICENEQLVQITNCSRIKDMECSCPNGTFNTNPELEPRDAKCVVYGPCGPGHGMKYAATPVKNTTCERCEPGKTFSSTNSSSDRCQPCTPCGQFKVKRECNTTHNRVCDTNGISSDDQDVTMDQDVTERLEIAIYVVGPIAAILLLVVVAVAVYILCKNYVDEKKGENTNDSATDNKDTSLSESVNSDDQVTSLSTILPSPSSANRPTNLSIPKDVPTNLQLDPKNLQQLPHSPNRFNGTDIEWRDNIFRINSYLSTELINQQQWKHVIRHLYEGCGKCVRDADREITEQERNWVGNIREQIYQCCLSWSRNPRASAEILRTTLSTECPQLLQGLRDKFPQIFNECQV